ncbi:uncharacterized protein L3040_008797 [Drepanopeziza brunnea f. sp. 'multigermtubi']|uniref:uncharacterized protein n=1 Tax=Drepanopeziza brunnea f. sp. 'multigermtubi' TaxID=698441 RepID=UPI0023883BF2|nr:hypothetical protein L3040_008797 [Drepanopeziza brunnea f. sp. 'multigermtubi']
MLRSQPDGLQLKGATKDIARRTAIGRVRKQCQEYSWRHRNWNRSSTKIMLGMQLEASQLEQKQHEDNTSWAYYQGYQGYQGHSWTLAIKGWGGGVKQNGDNVKDTAGRSQLKGGA